MNWPSVLANLGTFTPGVLLIIGLVAAIEGLYHRPREKLVGMWMTSATDLSRKLAESEKAREKLERRLSDTNKKLRETDRMLMLLALAVDQAIPILRQVSDDTAEMRQLTATLEKVRKAFNGGLDAER